MRIHFARTDRAERIAKSLRNHLKSVGHDIPFSRVKEATAVMYGYRNWNDLRASTGRQPASAYDDEIAEVERMVRRRDFGARLGVQLRLSPEIALGAVDAAGPMSRAAPGQPAQPGDWRDSIEAAAAAIASLAKSIEPLSFRNGSFRGFRVTFPSIDERNADARARRRLPPAYRELEISTGLLVSSDGAMIAVGDFPNGSFEDSDPLDTTENLNAVFKGHVLSFDPAEQASEPNPLVLETLSRLRPKAVERMRYIPSISPSAYRISAALQDGSAFARLLDQLPMMAAEIRNLAHEEGFQFPETEEEPLSRWLELRRDMVTSANPLEVYAELVSDYVERTWRPLVLDGERIEQVVRRIGNVNVRYDLGLQPWHTAFLSFAPDEALPRSPSQMKAAMHFIERWAKLFDPSLVGMDPADFYAEFKARFGNDWERVNSYSETRMDKLFHVRSELASAVMNGVALELGELNGLEDIGLFASSGRLGEFMASHALPGRGMAELNEMLDSWNGESFSDDHAESDPELLAAQVKGHFEGLFKHGLLPSDLAGATALGIAEMAGLDPDRIMDFDYDPDASRPAAE